MKKTMIGALVALTLGACTKEETYTRNYYYPTDESDPTGFQKGGNVIINEVESDESIMERVKNFDYLDGKTVIFLSPRAYSSNGKSYTVENPDPNYMLFPYSIDSMSDEWGWDYYEEYKKLGEKAFCEKYFDGELTLGMKLD